MRHKKLWLLACAFLSLFTLCLFSHNASAQDGIITNPSVSCDNPYYCYGKVSPGGLAWLYVPRTSFSSGDRSLPVLFYAASDGFESDEHSTYYDCTEEAKDGAQGIFILVEAWYMRSTGARTGYYRPVPNGQTKSSVFGAYITAPTIYDTTGDVKVYTMGQYLQDLYVPWQAKFYYLNNRREQCKSGTWEEAQVCATNRWNQGNFNWFCGSPYQPSAPDPTPEFSSMTNVFYDSTASSDVVSTVPATTVSSKFVDGDTDTPLQINVKPGAQVALLFNSYLKKNNDTTGNTSYAVKHTCEGSGSSICSSFKNDNFISQWSTYTATDRNQHSMITEAASITGHAPLGKSYIFSVPTTATTGTTFTVCEQISYKKTGTSSTDIKWTKACARITVSNDGDDDSGDNLYLGKTDVHYGSDFQSSGWGVQNQSQDISIVIRSTESYQDVSFYFDHFLKPTTSTAYSTQWEVVSSKTGSSGLTISISPSPINPSGSLTTTTERGVATGRYYTARISPNLTTQRVVTVCETLKFKTKPASSTLNGYTKGCVKITILPKIQDGECPVAGSKAPSAGTLSSGVTKVYAGAKNSSVAAFSSYVNTGVYAKPYDYVRFAHCYYPEAQAVQYTKTSHPQCESMGCGSYTEGYEYFVATQNKFRISTDNNKARSGESGRGLSFSPAYYYAFSNGGFSLSGNYTSSATFTGTVGSTASAVVYSNSNNDYRVQLGSAGGMIRQTITSLQNSQNSSSSTSHSWIYDEWDCSYTDDKGNYHQKTCRSYSYHTYIKGSKGGNVSDSAWIYVPFNFRTSLSTTITDSTATGGKDQVVLAGEEVMVSHSVTILPRYNATTNGSNGWVSGGTYATEPPADTAVRLISFFVKDTSALPSGSSNSSSDPCSYFGNSVYNCRVLKDYSNRSSWMYSNPNVNNGSTYNLTPVNTKVENVPAGYKFCTAIGISHADSGNDINSYSGPGSSVQVNNNWNISSPTCRTVAKRPSLQVWGGSLYTNGNIQTTTTTKQLSNSSSNSKSFGSWDEFALIVGTSGSIKGMASGAALGYDSPYSDPGTRKGGTLVSLYCSRSPLSIAARPNCETSNTISPSGITSTADTLFNRLKARYIDPANSQPATQPAFINLSNSSMFTTTYSGQYRSNLYRLTYAASGATISASASLLQGITHVIYAKGDITIKSNLIVNPGTYTNIDQIPQYIILAEGNVYIDGSVSQIDAWIIAKGSIDTCYGYNINNGTANVSTCGTHLTINGPVVASSLNLKRSAGAGAGESSGVYRAGTSGAVVEFDTNNYGADSAETFNLPLTAYLWGYSQATKFAEVYTVYTRELAPRL